MRRVFFFFQSLKFVQIYVPAGTLLSDVYSLITGGGGRDSVTSFRLIMTDEWIQTDKRQTE